MPNAGIEPATLRSLAQRSNQLSYSAATIFQYLCLFGKIFFRLAFEGCCSSLKHVKCDCSEVKALYESF